MWKRRPIQSKERRRRETNKENDPKKSSFPMVSSETRLWRLAWFDFPQFVNKLFISMDFYSGEICYTHTHTHTHTHIYIYIYI